MRFKQALSRKLAAALSAVMILSTIAPTSVPVLAAAPDDILVDSNVESVADVPVAEEAAGDELSAEVADGVVDLDEEGEVVEEAGLEPVADDIAAPVENDAAAPEGEGADTAEAPETAEGDMTITIKKGCTFSSISFAYIPRGGDGSEMGYRLATSATADASVTLSVSEGKAVKIVEVYKEGDTPITDLQLVQHFLISYTF